MQATHDKPGNIVAFPSSGERVPSALSPAFMARQLRRTNPLGARGFAQAMHEDAAWANEAWGRFWADVIRLV